MRPWFAQRLQGSFDCVAVRFANGNFAQDDKLDGAKSRGQFQ